MQDWFRDMLEVAGGMSIAVLTTLAFCKSIFKKYVYAQIEKSAEKELEKAKNSFSKSFTAYEILLKKEFEYYESIDKIYAEVIVDVQDIGYYSIEEKDVEKGLRCNNLKEISLRLLDSVKKLKNLNLLYQVYVPIDIFSVTGKVVVAIQENCDLISDTVMNVFEDKKCDEEGIKEFIDYILAEIAWSNTLIRSRLQDLTNQ